MYIYIVCFGLDSMMLLTDIYNIYSGSWSFDYGLQTVNARSMHLRHTNRALSLHGNRTVNRHTL